MGVVLNRRMKKFQGGGYPSQDLEETDEPVEINGTNIEWSIITRCYTSSSSYVSSTYGGTSVADYIGNFTLNWYQEAGNAETRKSGSNQFSKDGTKDGTAESTVSEKSYMYYRENFVLGTYQRFGKVTVNTSISVDYSYGSEYYRYYKISSVNTGISYASVGPFYFSQSGDTHYFSSTSGVGRCSSTLLETIYVDYYKRYTASFNSNGGTSVSSKNFYAAHSYTLPSAAPTRTGYTFGGWYNSSLGTTYSVGDTVSASYCDSNHSWTATWVANTYTNTYYYRNSSGTATSTTQSRTYGSSFTTLSSTALSYYTSNGWSLYGWVYGSSTSTTRTYAASTSVTAAGYTNSTDTLYWYAISSRTVSLTYNANGGTYSGSSTTGTQYWNQYGTTRTAVSLTVTSTAPTRTGYTFLGWATSSTATTSAYAAGSTYSFSAAYSSAASVTLYAVWSVNSYTISFNKNGGTAGAATISATYGTSYTFPTATAAGSSTGFVSFTRTGYTLSSWNSNTSGTGTSYTLGGAYSNLSSANGATVTLYAVWTINSYKLTVNYSASGTASTTYNKLSVSATSGTVASSTVSSGSSTTITANYSVSSITVTVGRASTSYTWYIYAGTSSTTVPTTSSATNSTTYIWTPTANATIYVKMYQRYTISYNKGYGTGTAPSTQYKIYNGSVTLATNNLTLSGCEAKGWNTSSTGTGTAYANGASYSTNANLTLYTAWTARNPLKYDSTFKYFYFEDGEYPQSEANSLSFTDVFTGSNSGLTFSYDASDNLLTINGSQTASSTAIFTISGMSFTQGINCSLTIEKVSGTVTIPDYSCFVMDIRKSNNANVSTRNYKDVSLSSSSGTWSIACNSTAESEGERIVIWLWQRSGTTIFDNAVYRVKVSYDMETILNKSATANGEKFTYNNGTENTEIPVYTYNSERYVKVTKDGTSAWFKFEPIRWRVSDYGVSSTEYPSGWSSYASYNTNFTAVSDLILGFGAMNSTRNVSEGTAVSSMSGFVNVQNFHNTTQTEFTYSVTNTDDKDIELTVDRYGVTANGEGNAVYSTSVTYSSPLRVASIEEIEELGIKNKSARASDMVAFILGVDKDRVSYWTRGLSNLGSGVAISATGTEIRSWLDVCQGIRFAYTFSEGVRM